MVTRAITYAYDGLYRLTEADYSSGENFQYTYDAVGNMTALTASITNTVVTTKAYDAANRLLTVTTGSTIKTLDWSDAGELLRDGDDVYAWNAAGRMVRATVGGVVSRYAYLGDGSRISMTVDGATTTYTLDLASPLVQVLIAHGTGESTTYLNGIVRIGEHDGEWQYHLVDHLGSVRSLVGADGSVQGVRAYQPYGAPLNSAGSGNSIYGFTGEQTDPTGLIFLRARMLDPAQGRFLRRDPWDGNDEQTLTLNAYLYALANPINMLDPSGLCSSPSDDNTVCRSTPFDPDGSQCETLRTVICDIFGANVLPGRDTRAGRDWTLYWSLEDMMTLFSGLMDWSIALGEHSEFLFDMKGEFDVIRITGRSNSWDRVKLGPKAFPPFGEWVMGNDGWKRPRGVIHEIAHLWSDRTGYQIEFNALFWLNDETWCEGEDPVTEYGAGNSFEDFAEAATEMILRNNVINRTEHPRRFNFMLNRMRGLQHSYGSPDPNYPE